MRRGMALTTRLDQRLMMNQKLKQVITFLQFTTQELKQQIKEIIETNPLIEICEETEDSEEAQSLEEGEWEINYAHSQKSTSYVDSSHDEYIQNLPEIKTLRSSLLEQTLNCHFDNDEQMIATMIIDAIDDDGLLMMEIDELYEMAFAQDVIKDISTEKIMNVLSVIQGFEPLGIAARSIKECLLIQLRFKNDGREEFDWARKMIEVEALSLNTIDFKSLSKSTGLTQQQLTAALNIIKNLDFHPAKSFNDHRNNVSDPELYTRKIGNKWQAFLTDSILTKLDINKHYKSLIKKNSRDKAYKSILNQLQEASYLVSGIKRRNDTLLSVANYIVSAQADFLESGSVGMKSINLAEVAEALGFHESTISRITTGKYISTPHGIFELKYFFPSQVSTESGSTRSSTAVKTLIKEIIDHETPDSTHSDDDIALMLKEKGINISRRTVTKYRESLEIPTSYLRKGVNELK